MRLRSALVLVTSAVLLAGCASSAGNRSGYEEETPVSDIVGEWQLAKGSDAEGAMVVNGAPVTLVIADDAVSGQGPCNVYGGDLSVDGSDISIDSIHQTLMACDDDSRNRLETRYMAALENVSQSKLGGTDPETLTLSGPDASLRFTVIEKKAAN